MSPIAARTRRPPLNSIRSIAFKVKDEATALKVKERLEKDGHDVVGPTNHHIFQSIYFRDPDGHRLELAYDTATAEEMQRLHDVAPQMLEDWTKSKTTQRHASWLHEEEFSKDK